MGKPKKTAPYYQIAMIQETEPKPSGIFFNGEELLSDPDLSKPGTSTAQYVLIPRDK